MINILLLGGRLHFRFFQKRGICFFILSIFILYSCTNHENNEKIISSYVDVAFDSKNFSIKNDFIGSNESCNSIFVRAQNQTSTDDYFTIDFRLTKLGALEKIMLSSKSSGGIFSSADFNPTALISIKNFNYDETKKYLYFEFEGELIREDSSYENLDKTKEKKYIKGIVSIINVKNTNCTSTINDLNFQIENLKFLTNSVNSSYENTNLTNPYTFSFYSDNGYGIVFKLNENPSNLKKGIYNFNEKSITNRIDFEKYIGNFRSTGLLWIRDTDWQKYITIGSFTILENFIINDQKVIKGEINLQIFDNGILKYDIAKAEFVARGF